MDEKLCSVIIPVYNGEKYLSETLESALSQDYGALEIILVNDASVDGSLELALHYQNMHPTIISIGSVRPMKRTIHILRAFELAKERIPNLKLIIAGDLDSGYGEKFQHEYEKSIYKDSIKVLGKVGKEKKIEILQKSHLLCVTSVKEGWGLVVTEANSQGTPAIVYDVDGLRDSVKNNVTGIVCKYNTSECMAHSIVKLLSEGSFSFI